MQQTKIWRNSQSGPTFEETIESIIKYDNNIIAVIPLTYGNMNGGTYINSAMIIYIEKNRLKPF